MCTLILALRFFTTGESCLLVRLVGEVALGMLSEELLIDDKKFSCFPPSSYLSFSNSLIIVIIISIAWYSLRARVIRIKTVSTVYEVSYFLKSFS